MTNFFLSKKAVEEYQRIYKKTLGEEISYQEASEQGMRLLKAFELIYKPIINDLLKKL